MRGTTLGLMLAVAAGSVFATMATVGGNFASAPAAEYTLDTSKLARVEGAKEIYASPSTTIFTTPDSVLATAAAATKLLAAEGWQHYEDPFSLSALDSNVSIMTFKKDRQGLSVFVTLAPAQGNATSVSYTADAIVDDLPFPKDASEIKFAPDRPYLSLVTKIPLEASLAFFRDELAARGWAAWSRKDNRKLAAGDDLSEPNERGKFAFFVRENHAPLMLQLQSRDDGRLNASLEGVAEDVLAALTKKQEPAAAPAPEKTEKTDDPNTHDAFDAMAGEILNQVRKATDQALSDINKPPPKEAASPPAAIEPLSELAAGSAPVPLPSTAENIDFDGAQGDLEFESASTVKSVAAFYREAMKRSGWNADHSVINKDNMVVLRFSKGEQDLSFTIMTFGAKTRVSASGSGLVTEAPAAEAATADPLPDPSETGAPSSENVTELTAEENSGLPLPAPHSLSGNEKSLFRLSVNASVPATVETVLAFYRRELAKLDWKEQVDGTQVAAVHAEIAYATSQGPAVLKLTRSNGETTAVLTVRKEDEAKKAGLLPQKGKIKLMFGNILDKDAILTIDTTKVKIAAGLGAKKPDGPTLEIGPGKHKYSLRVPGQPEQAEEFDVAAGDIWGLMVGPGGVLALQMY